VVDGATKESKSDSYNAIVDHGCGMVRRLLELRIYIQGDTDPHNSGWTATVVDKLYADGVA
jgi:hypothetical protein